MVRRGNIAQVSPVSQVPWRENGGECITSMLVIHTHDYTNANHIIIRRHTCLIDDKKLQEQIDEGQHW